MWFSVDKLENNVEVEKDDWQVDLGSRNTYCMGVVWRNSRVEVWKSSSEEVWRSSLV